jgi:hypothetical protein
MSKLQFKARARKAFNSVKKQSASIGTGVVAVGSMVAAGAANAALDAAVTTEIANTSANITEAGTLIIGLAVVAMGVRWVKATFF